MPTANWRNPKQYANGVEKKTLICGDRHARSDRVPAIRTLLCQVSPTGKENGENAHSQGAILRKIAKKL